MVLPSAAMLKNFKVHVTAEFDIAYLWRSNYTLCHDQKGHPLNPNEVREFKCIQRAWGRYVVIIKAPTMYENLVICEVEVYDSNHLCECKKTLNFMRTYY